MIGGINGSMGMMNMQAMQQHREQAYNKIDSDGDGIINKTELETFSEKISERTGKTLNTGDAFSSFDADGDGMLNKEEMRNFMVNSGVRPPPPPFQQAMSAYGANFGSDQIPSLLDLPDNQSEDEDSSSYWTETGNVNIKTLLDMIGNRSSSEDINSLVDALT